MSKWWLTLVLLQWLSMVTQGAELIEQSEEKKEMPELHHVFDVKLAKGMRPGKEFRLDPERKIICKTCHGIKDIKDMPNDEVNTFDENFLRGGPYRNITDFCYNCHDEEKSTRSNIHNMLDENGDIKEEHCKFCHEEVLKRDKAKKLDELKLRMPPESICYGCHLKTPHLNALQHQVKPDEKKLEQLKKSSKELAVYLPLSAKGKIMCVTCHTPHPPGVLDKSLAAAKQVEVVNLDEGVTYEEHPWGAVYQADKLDRLEEFNIKNAGNQTLKYQRINTEVLLRLSAKKGQLCLSCHTFEN